MKPWSLRIAQFGLAVSEMVIPKAVFRDAKFIIYDLQLHERRHFCCDFHFPWDQMITMNKSAILFVNGGWSQLTSTSYCCELFVNTGNLHQEILDYLVAKIWSLSIPDWIQPRVNIHQLKKLFHPSSFNLNVVQDIIFKK